MTEPRTRFRSHYRPRTPEGRTAVVAFLILFALCQPPIVHGVVNRVEPWIGGLPFLYAWLLGVYVAMIGVLVWALRKRV
jgi:hypothetical protein